jgi:hypothetical protein
MMKSNIQKEVPIANNKPSAYKPAEIARRRQACQPTAGNIPRQSRLNLKPIPMFGLFKKKSEKEKLQETYAKMMADAHKLSHSNRTAADKLMAEAEEVAKQIDALNKA